MRERERESKIHVQFSDNTSYILRFISLSDHIGRCEFLQSDGVFKTQKHESYIVDILS